MTGNLAEPSTAPPQPARPSIEERARILAGRLIVSSNLGVYEPACLAALRAARADALDEAAAVCDDEREPDIAARLRALKESG